MTSLPALKVDSCQLPAKSPPSADNVHVERSYEYLLKIEIRAPDHLIESLYPRSLPDLGKLTAVNSTPLTPSISPNTHGHAIRIPPQNSEKEAPSWAVKTCFKT